MKQDQSNKRRSRLPQPRFQLRLVGVFAGLCALALLGQALVVGALLTEISGTMSSGGSQLGESVPEIMVRSVLASALLILPPLMLIGIRITFRFAGPLYRIEQHLKTVVKGEWPGPCQVRKTDEMQELCQLLNAALESARAQGESAGAVQTENEEHAAA